LREPFVLQSELDEEEVQHLVKAADTISVEILKQEQLEKLVRTFGFK